MKLIIDIDKELKSAVYNCGLFLNPTEKTSLINAINNGIPILDNATNGDIMQTMFPNADIEIHNITVYVIFDMHSNVISFDLDWWNAPCG